MSSVTVAKASVILAFKLVISEAGVKNTLSLTNPHKKKSRGVISGDHCDQGVGPSLPSTCLEMLHPKTNKHLNPSVEVHHLVGKLSTAETLLTEVFVCMPRSCLVINVCNRERLYVHPVYQEPRALVKLPGNRIKTSRTAPRFSS